MPEFIESILFITISLTVFAIAGRKAYQIYRNIRLGKAHNLSDNKGQRLKNMLLVAFGQKKMFKNLTPALLHLVIYLSFVITQTELLEIFYDGITGNHRGIYHLVENISFLKGGYVFAISFIEVLSVLTFIVTVAFLWRRNLLKVPRLNMAELKGWPMLDANLILAFEIYLITCIFMMNTADMAIGHNSYGFLISGMLSPVFGGLSEGVLHIMEKIGWWGHVIGVFGFMLYIPHSKHLHIILAFPNTYFGRLTPKGQVENLESVTKEIRIMMNPDTAFAAPAETPAEPVKFGAKDVFDLSWKNLLDAYSCTECGRCTAACPANQTGKKLSPRKIMMDTRDRLEEVGKIIQANKNEWKDDGKTLIENGYISVEELRACTTCNACVEECPVSISPLDIIIELRRHLILEESNSPEEWNGMFSNIENNGAPWQFSAQDRLKWTE